MSYFVCGFKTSTVVFDDCEKALADIVPGQIRGDSLRIEGKSSFVAIYGNTKIIRNLVIRNADSGSWLVMIGTPLVRLKSESENLGFLADFLANPTQAMREKIDGNFAIFAFDAANDRLIAATDFNNTTPIFYTVAPNGVLLSSHELPLARVIRPGVDSFGFAQAIHLGVTWSTHTRFRNIHKLLPCQVVSIDGARNVNTERYWRPQDETMWRGTLDDHVDRWGALLRNAVLKYYECADQKPVLADLTAGEDARLVLAQCHALGIPFKAHVIGLGNDVDVTVATEAARRGGFELITRQRHPIGEEQLLANAQGICLRNDGYLEYFKACIDFATETASPLDEYSVVKYNGFPGGEAFRGSYYLRGKAVFPTLKTNLDYKFLIRMKYLLDYKVGLLKHPDTEFIDSIYEIARNDLQDVAELPIGTRIDHMLRVFQSCFSGLKYKNPLYLPLASASMTRSIYSLSPHFKQAGRLTKACTEVAFPELAGVKTQSGVPTVRRTIRRQAVFLPEYLALARKISRGVAARLFKWTEANAWQHSASFTTHVFTTLLNRPPYCDWFSSSHSMITGEFYNSEPLNALLTRAKSGSCKYVPLLERIIAQELALRWVYGEKIS